MLSEKELIKRATILNILELSFNESQDIYLLTIDRIDKTKKENNFICYLYRADTNKLIRTLKGNYGTIKRYVLSLPIIRATTTPLDRIARA